jgi:hypothetical protein
MVSVDTKVSMIAAARVFKRMNAQRLDARRQPKNTVWRSRTAATAGNPGIDQYHHVADALAPALFPTFRRLEQVNIETSSSCAADPRARVACDARLESYPYLKSGLL